jgi:hypothetical protein
MSSVGSTQSRGLARMGESRMISSRSLPIRSSADASKAALSMGIGSSRAADEFGSILGGMQDEPEFVFGNSLWCSQTDDVQTRPFQDTRLQRFRILTSTTISTSRPSITFALRPLAHLAALLYFLLLDHFGLPPLPSPRICTALGLTGSPGRLGTLNHRSQGHLSTPSCYTKDLPDALDRDV